MNLLIKVQFIAILLLGVLLFISVRQCNSNDARAENWQAVAEYKSQKIDSLRNAFNLWVTEQRVAQTNDAAEIKRLSAQLFELDARQERRIKKVEALVSVRQIARITDTLIQFDRDTVYRAAGGMIPADSVVIPPRDFKAANAFYSISGTVQLQGVRINDLTLPNTVSFRIADKKVGLFKTDKVVQVINSNPYFSNTGASSITLKHRVNAWNKWIKPVGAAVLTALLTSQLRR